MQTDFMTKQDAETGVRWMRERIKQDFPEDFFPKTGLVVRDGDRLLCLVVIFLDPSCPVGIAGWCVSNPENTARESHTAIRLLFAAFPVYARQIGVKHLVCVFGNRGINRILDRGGYSQGDMNVQHKLMRLR